MNETNVIAEAVTEAQSSLSRVNVTLIWIAVIQVFGTVLAAWTTVLSKIILKDVNSDRTARIAEVKTLNEKLVVVEKLKSVLETQAESNKAK